MEYLNNQIKKHKENLNELTNIIKNEKKKFIGYN